MNNKIVYTTQWVARDRQKEYPHGWGFDAPIVEFSQEEDPAIVAKICREKLSNDEFECIGAIPRQCLLFTTSSPTPTVDIVEQLEKNADSMGKLLMERDGEIESLKNQLLSQPPDPSEEIGITNEYVKVGNEVANSIFSEADKEFQKQPAAPSVGVLVEALEQISITRENANFVAAKALKAYQTPSNTEGQEEQEELAKELLMYHSWVRGLV